MTHKHTLMVTSLISILLGSLHLANDVVFGIEPGGTSNYTGVVILAVALYATIALAGRRSGYMLTLIFAIGASGVSYLHMTGVGMVGGHAAGKDGLLFWVWTLFALGATGLVTVALAAQGLWGSFRTRT